MLYPKKNSKRTLDCLDGIWETEIEGVYRDMAVPASYNEQYNDLFNYFGECRYIKKVYIDEISDDSDLWIRFGSVTTNAKVYINGTFVGEHRGTALPFEFKITEIAKQGSENTIEVIVDNTLDPWGLPPAVLMDNNEGRVGFYKSYPAVTYDFFPYGGIHRSVFLYTASKNRIEDIKIDTALSGKVNFRLTLANSVQGKIKAYVDGTEYEYTVDGSILSGEFVIENPRIWDIGKPELYDVRFDVEVNGNVCDTYTQTFGIREVEVKGYKIYLNNREIFLKGFGKHEDFPIIGKGFNGALMVKDFYLMDWIGANSFRTSHYPYDEQMLDYADRHGVLVIDETPFVGLNERMYTDDILDRAKVTIGELINRDYNHPCVIMWSMANEPMASTPEAERFFREMHDCARSYDTTRPITYVAHGEPENNVGMKYYDIICLNKYYGWYYGAGQIDETLSDLSACMDRFHNAFDKGVIMAEFGADAIAGMHTDPAQMFSEEYQCEIIKKQYELMCSKDYIAGTHIWAFADFKTAQSISRILVNRKGLFTRERQPKMAAHMVKDMWSK